MSHLGEFVVPASALGASQPFDPAVVDITTIGGFGDSSYEVPDVHVSAGEQGPVLDSWSWTNEDESGLWSLDANWEPRFTDVGPFPNSADAVAYFGDPAVVPAGPLIPVSVSSDVTVRAIDFENAAKTYSIGGTGQIELFGEQESPAMLYLVEGTHQISSPLEFDGRAIIRVNDAGVLTLNGTVTHDFGTLRKDEDGELRIMGTLTTTRTLEVVDGMLSGTGTIDGSGESLRLRSGTVAPGNDGPGTLTVAGAYLQDALGTLSLEIAGQVAGTEHDQLVVEESLTLGGTVEIQLAPGYTPTGGESFNLLDFDSLVDTGYTLVFDPLVPGPGMTWNDTLFATAGVVSIDAAYADGDFNRSGLVEANDLDLVLFHWNQLGSELPAEWTHMRPADTERVGSRELDKVLFTWGDSGPVSAAVPEPTGWAICVTLLLLGRRFV